MATMYCHTIDGIPAKYEEGRQICYLGYRKSIEKKDCKKTLREIRREQKKSSEWRVQQGFERFDKATSLPQRYGYFRIKFS